MKLLLSSILILLVTNAFSQKSILEKLWVGNNNEYVTADTDVIRFETFIKPFGNIRVAQNYLLTGDTLRLFRSDVHNKLDCADFLIDTLQKAQLILAPIETNAVLLTNTITGTGIKKKLHFREIHQVYTDSIKFEKILFHSTTCYGFCPSMTLEIDNKKQLQFIGHRFTVKEGSFCATLPDSLFYELIELLKVAELDKIEGNTATNIDAPTYTLEIHYNNKVRRLKSCMLPFVTEGLLQYLLAIPGKIKLIPATRSDGQQR